MQEFCKVEGCGKRAIKKDCCDQHYRHFIRYGEARTIIRGGVNEYITEGDITKIVLKDQFGKVLNYALIDTEDVALVKDALWKYNTSTGYVGTSNTGIFLHKVILQTKGNVDHINRIPRDCRKSNLRQATQSQNMMNCDLRRDNRSGMRGVKPMSCGNKWRAILWYQGKEIFIGSFECRIAAMWAYNQKSLELFGEFAYQNKIEDVKPLSAKAIKASSRRVYNEY